MTIEGNDLSPFGLLFGADRFPVAEEVGSNTNRMSLIAQDWEKFQTFADVAANMLQNQNQIHQNYMNNQNTIPAKEGGSVTFVNKNVQVPSSHFFIETTPANKRDQVAPTWAFQI